MGRQHQWHNRLGNARVKYMALRMGLATLSHLKPYLVQDLGRHRQPPATRHEHRVHSDQHHRNLEMDAMAMNKSAHEDVVVFDNSGSMNGHPIDQSFRHALETFGPKTKWRTSTGSQILEGLLGDDDAFARITSYMGPMTFQHAIAFTCAPGVAINVYTDSLFELVNNAQDPFSILDGIGGKVFVAGQYFNESLEQDYISKHPDVRFERIFPPVVQAA